MRSWLSAGAVAARQLRTSLLRTLLTVCAVTIGVVTVALVGTAGDAASQRLQRQLEQLGPSVFSIEGADTADGAQLLTVEDARVLGQLSQVARTAPAVTIRAEAATAGRYHTTQVTGSTADYFRITNWPTAAGAHFRDNEAIAGAPPCVLGASVAEKLNLVGSIVGRHVEIGGVRFIVAGVLKAKGADVFGADQDDVLFVPLSALRRKLMGDATGRGGVDYVLAAARNADGVPAAIRAARLVLRGRHRLDAAQPEAFRIASRVASAKTMKESVRVLTLVLTAVGAVSLAVGGVGIMNIMLVAVTERRREIAVRLALGATAADIRRQFLLEALFLALMGGVLGVLITIVLTWVAAEALPRWSIQVSAPALSVGLGCCVALGIGFGYAPARRAGTIEPSAALAQD